MKSYTYNKQANKRWYSTNTVPNLPQVVRHQQTCTTNEN